MIRWVDEKIDCTAGSDDDPAEKRFGVSLSLKIGMHRDRPNVKPWSRRSLLHERISNDNSVLKRNYAFTGKRHRLVDGARITIFRNKTKRVDISDALNVGTRQRSNHTCQLPHNAAFSGGAGWRRRDVGASQFFWNRRCRRMRHLQNFVLPKNVPSRKFARSEFSGVSHSTMPSHRPARKRRNPHLYSLLNSKSLVSPIGISLTPWNCVMTNSEKRALGQPKSWRVNRLGSLGSKDSWSK